MKRPLCLFAVVFVVIIAMTQLFPIPFLKKVSESCPELTEGQEVCVVGQLYKAENKNDRIIYYLKNVSVFETEFSFYINQNSNQTLSQSSNQISNQNPNLVENQNSRSSGRNRKPGAVCYVERSDMLYPVGMTLCIKGTVFPYETAENEGQFDGKMYYENIGYGIRLVDCRVVLCGKSGDLLGQILVDIKAAATDRYRMYMTEENAGTLSAMLLGNKEFLDREVKELYRRNGISHILAISGLHISMLGMLVYRLLRRLGAFPVVCSVISIISILVYIKMIETGVSSYRAVCMFLLGMAANLLRRTYDLKSALALSACLWLLAHPSDVFQAGFLFSYSAVLSLAVADPVLQEPGRKRENFRRKQRRRKRHILIEFFFVLTRKLQSAIISSFSVQVFLLPFTFWFYYEFPVYSFLLNLVIIPCMSVLLICGLLGALPVPGSFIALVTADKLLEIYSWLCRWVETLPGAVIITGRPKLWQMVLYYVLIFGWLFFYRRREQDRCEAVFGRRECLRFLIPLLCMMIFFIPLQGENRLDMLSVGQGDCVCMQDASGHVVLVDAGSTDVSDVGKYRLIPYLKYHGIRRVDVVFLSHAHEDHYSAIYELLESGSKVGVQIGTLCLVKPDATALEKTTYDAIAALAAQSGCKVVWLNAGDKISVGEMDFTVVYPPDYGEQKGEISDENDRSMVLLGSLKDFRMLFTGDCSFGCDPEIIRKLKQMGIEKIHCLKVAHHGAQTSTSEELLASFDFDLALVSCGADNSYGHPHAALLERLQNAGCHIFVTSQCGQITVKIQEKKLTVSSRKGR